MRFIKTICHKYYSVIIAFTKKKKKMMSNSNKKKHDTDLSDVITVYIVIYSVK